MASTSRLTQSLAQLCISSPVRCRANVGSSLLRASGGVPRLATLHPRSRPVQASWYASHAPATATFRIGNLQPAQPTKNRKRLGRGPGSGRGGTATRGHKGQKARRGNGKPVPGFEGGQTPLHRRYPKRGFTNIHASDLVPVNVDRIQHWVDRGLLDASQPITAKELFESRCIHNLRDGVKLLGDGAQHLRQPLNIVVSRASSTAIRAIEAVGGEIVCRYYNRLTLRALVKPHKFDGRLLPRPADPVAKKDILYYSSRQHRGYLAKRAGERMVATEAVKAQGAASAETVAAAISE